MAYFMLTFLILCDIMHDPDFTIHWGCLPMARAFNVQHRSDKIGTIMLFFCTGKPTSRPCSAAMVNEFGYSLPLMAMQPDPRLPMFPSIGLAI